MFAETSERLVDRRQIENRFFLATNSLVLSLAGVLTHSGFSRELAGVSIIGLAAVGLLLCHLWHAILTSYWQLNKAKFDVLEEIENKLAERNFTREWQVLNRPDRDFTPFTKIEQNVPKFFALLHSAVLVLGVLGLVGAIS